MRTLVRLQSCLRLLTVMSVAVFADSSQAQKAQPVVTAALRSGTLSFAAHATVGDFVGSTATVSGTVSGSVSNPHGWVEAPVTTLVTHNDRRDRDLRSSMEVATYPTIRFDLAGATVVSDHGHGDTLSVVLHGTLAIHGVTRAVNPLAAIVRDGDSIHVASTFPLDVRDYRIGGLTKLFGTLRMDPMIGVRLDLLFVVTPTLTSVGSER